MAHPNRHENRPYRDESVPDGGRPALQAPSASALKMPATSPKRLRVPIFLKLVALCTLLVLAVAMTISISIINRQKDQFVAQLIDLGENTVRIVARNAADKLLSEEDLALFRLIGDVAANKQVVFALITDHNGIIRAHSKSIEEVGKPYSPPAVVRQLKAYPEVVTGSFRLNGVETLLFDGPIIFKQVRIGEVKVGISLNSIEENIRRAKWSIALLTLLITVAGILLSLGLSVYFTHPIKRLEDGTHAVAAGRLTHRVRIGRNDEFGDLAQNFNKMAGELELKERIKSSFGRYVTPEIVEMIIANPNSTWMKGAEVQASVLFVDIRGFTAISEHKEPVDVVELLNSYFKLVTEAVVQNGGHLNKFIGDEAMAIFGAPVPNRNHAAAAVQAALDIQRQMAHLEPGCGALGAPIQVGIGINSGKMVAGNLGSETRMEYTVIGDNVNVASRLTSLAKGGEIIISQNTFDRLDAQTGLAIEAKGSVALRGRQTAMAIYRVAGTTATEAVT